MIMAAFQTRLRFLEPGAPVLYGVDVDCIRRRGRRKKQTEEETTQRSFGVVVKMKEEKKRIPAHISSIRITVILRK